MIELRNADTVWSMSDTSEASAVIRGNNRIPHPLEHAINEAKVLGYQIDFMDFVKVLPEDEREKPFESPAIMLYHPDQEGYAAIVQTPKRAGFGRSYKIITYEE